MQGAQGGCPQGGGDEGWECRLIGFRGHLWTNQDSEEGCLGLRLPCVEDFIKKKSLNGPYTCRMHTSRERREVGALTALLPVGDILEKSFSKGRWQMAAGMQRKDQFTN
jgi:hypothetical protein